jgi:hypothetical protein
VRAIATRFRGSVAGLSPATIALILAVGLVLGVFPVYGCPTVLCVAAALALRLNLPAVQIINQLALPLQLALLVPLNRFGARVLRGYLPLPASWSVAGAARDAIMGWLCLCVPLGIALYFILVFALRLGLHRHHDPAGPGHRHESEVGAGNQLCDQRRHFGRVPLWPIRLGKHIVDEVETAGLHYS